MPSAPFRTLPRESYAVNPSGPASPHPRLASLAAPHLESFDSIFDFAPSPGGGGPRPGAGPGGPGAAGRGGLLDTAVSALDPVVLFDGVLNAAAQGGRPGAGEPPGPPALGNKLELWIDSVQVARPAVADSAKNVRVRQVYPAECRERGTTYKGKIQTRLCWRVNGGPVQKDIRSFGSMPIMVRSLKCHLHKLTPKALVRHHEDVEEFGGYFVVNGIERLIRLLIMPRRNHPIAIIRPSFMKRGSTYSDKGVTIRSVRPDQSSASMTIHYCTDGNITLRFSYRKQEFMVPVVLVLKALLDVTDQSIFERLIMGKVAKGTGSKDTFLTDRVELLLRESKRFPVHDRSSCLEYLGQKFAVMLDSPEDRSLKKVGRDFLRRIVAVHLTSDRDKFNLLIFMMQKLYSLVAGDCAPDNPDSPMHQEVLLGGHLYLTYFKDRLAEWLLSIKAAILADMKRSSATLDFLDNRYLPKLLAKTQTDIGKKLEYFLATGNLITNTGMDLQQTSGYTIVAEKLNFYRYLSHFGSIHRGAFFAELKTTTVRKLLPEAWGFLCPVHTPDGSPCGLLNHLSHTCQIIVENIETTGLVSLIASLGVSQPGPGVVMIHSGSQSGPDAPESVTDADEDDEELLKTTITVQLDGCIIGFCTAAMAFQVARQLRHWKVTHHPLVPLSLEIGLVLPSRGGQYPGLFLFSSPSRMMRPVKYLATGTTDLVGSFEQVYMDIAVLKEDIVPGVTTHMDWKPTDMLSVVANLTPFSDFNQSPRNMYQCQMGKQSMGTPAHNLPHRTDNKLYRLQSGQTPIVRPAIHNDYGMDNYPNGTNAVVCVISYTGYDMEDAMILNKSSFERGFGYGSIYKSEFIDLAERRKAGVAVTRHFGLIPKEGGRRLPKAEWDKVSKFLDKDGFPHIGTKLTDGDPLYAYVDEELGVVKVVKYKSLEDAYVDEVRMLGNDNGDQAAQKIHIKFRIPRAPLIGDKFSSRHGQKGVCSQKYPLVDMPFSESGISPDVIINPHAFPSRMTIGMFVESIAGKAGALHGLAQDSTPFTFSESYTAADHFGSMLTKAGYNYHGNEPMYSGITGREFQCDIYIGVVYYQRLRHMVSDKYQVRTTGPVHNLTQQPVQGRKRAGGIRFGEMERDSLLAHGVSFLLQDRLLNCSDYSQVYVCATCGSVLSPTSIHAKDTSASTVRAVRSSVTCLVCESPKGVRIVQMPFVFRYLATELMAMGVKLNLELK